MICKIIEATDVGQFNHGKFMVRLFEHDEYNYMSRIAPEYLLRRFCNYPRATIWVDDLYTGEGCRFAFPSYRIKENREQRAAHVKESLNRHRIWVCPMFEPFVTWLLGQDLSDLSCLPDVVDSLPDDACSFWGYRRPGPPESSEASAQKPSPSNERRKMTSSSRIRSQASVSATGKDSPPKRPRVATIRTEPKSRKRS